MARFLAARTSVPLGEQPVPGPAAPIAAELLDEVRDLPGAARVTKRANRADAIALIFADPFELKPHGCRKGYTLAARRRTSAPLRRRDAHQKMNAEAHRGRVAEKTEV